MTRIASGFPANSYQLPFRAEGPKCYSLGWSERGERRPRCVPHGVSALKGRHKKPNNTIVLSNPKNTAVFRPYRADDSLMQSTWASARRARSSPGYNIAGFQP